MILRHQGQAPWTSASQEEQRKRPCRFQNRRVRPNSHGSTRRRSRPLVVEPDRKTRRQGFGAGTWQPILRSCLCCQLPVSSSFESSEAAKPPTWWNPIAETPAVFQQAVDRVESQRPLLSGQVGALGCFRTFHLGRWAI